MRLLLKFLTGLEYGDFDSWDEYVIPRVICVGNTMTVVPLPPLPTLGQIQKGFQLVRDDGSTEKVRKCLLQLPRLCAV